MKEWSPIVSSQCYVTFLPSDFPLLMWKSTGWSFNGTEYTLGNMMLVCSRPTNGLTMPGIHTKCPPTLLTWRTECCFGLVSHRLHSERSSTHIWDIMSHKPRPVAAPRIAVGEEPQILPPAVKLISHLLLIKNTQRGVRFYCLLCGVSVNDSFVTLKCSRHMFLHTGAPEILSTLFVKLVD